MKTPHNDRPMKKLMCIVPATYEELYAKGVDFGILMRDLNGYWDEVITVHPFCRAEREIKLSGKHTVLEFKKWDLRIIPQLVKIICIADCFDAMTSNRPYRSPMEYSVAKEKMLEVAGTQLDGELVKSFFELLETTGEGYRSIYHVEGIPEPSYSEENEQRIEKRNGKEKETQ